MANHDRKDHWSYTAESLRAVLNELFQFIGPKKHIHCVADGCARQVKILKCLAETLKINYFLIKFK
jgi:hypothetical protein